MIEEIKDEIVHYWAERNSDTSISIHLMFIDGHKEEKIVYLTRRGELEYSYDL